VTGGTYSTVAGLRVDSALKRFVDDEALRDAPISSEMFWTGLAALIEELTPRNRALLAERARLQEQIDAWHREHPIPFDANSYRSFLADIGYLVREPAAVAITTRGVDPAIAELAGPQLVVPVTNARYVLNAANARWGSLYDALYGTDAIPGAARSRQYDPVRGREVIAYVRTLLDEFVPLDGGSHGSARGYRVEQGALVVECEAGRTPLRDPSAFRGYTGAPERPSSVLLVHNGLHIELVIDRSSPVGAADPAGIADVILEAALTTIVDFEDSVAAVDAEEKVVGYRNWLGLARGDLVESFDKAGSRISRELADDRVYTAADGSVLTLPGRSVLFVRNVGHHMFTDAVHGPDGQPVPEGILDAAVTALCAIPGISDGNRRRNGSEKSIYVVKPKMHGPEEVAFTADLFGRVEDLLRLPRNTMKIGLMDEERRTSVNLKACIAEVRDRLVFINTGFLDRSGDEIHTSRVAAPVVRKASMRSQRWIAAYEDQNVDIGLDVGLPGHGQIGKGMWAMPDLMAAMLEQKVAHPRSGATTAWVPSPTAATLHAIHYHRVDVRQRQAELRGRGRAPLAAMLEPPFADPRTWSAAEVREELHDNAQSILGYVVRWINEGVGCSKVPDIHDVALMEDRATLRISSQLLANWLLHGVITRDQVHEAFECMAVVVDRQNANDPLYEPMGPDFDASIAFQAALDLVLHGADQPNGYTEPILHQRRREYKQRLRARQESS
jgi:malate synthase